MLASIIALSFSLID
ncbi:uncharacterized protein FFC1_14826 [Fusarium fujikuroi]|nr:uncharacterized protein FFC1_08635 [Fusarium fujikuroi]SCO23560.1 uncharacterized protein FFC1_14825 [Fusarium fujikuroi]SCO23561.1 uncharacterized protein FFC1_14826 [Fusarium fujikuroi]